MKKICVVTATRAEYGLLRNLIKKIEADCELELCLVVTGTHLSQRYGNTVEEIMEDGFLIAEKVDILEDTDSDMGIIKTMANAMYKFGETFERLRPDMLVVLGDRYELLPICQSAFMLKIPIAHISGGEITEGAVDDTVRHCVTKMSRLHFPGCEVYRRRIIQLGEQPEAVFNYGDVGVENILHMNYMEKAELEESLQFRLDLPYACVTFHPATMEAASPEQQVHALLHALEQFDHMKFVFTGANADSGGDKINEMIRQFVDTHSNCCMFASLGIRRYLSLLKGSEMIVGNSSSGIVEAPCFGIPTVNIGTRQKGRVQADSILNCEPDCDAIRKTMKTALTKEFKKIAAETTNPYGAGDTSEGIVRQIKKFLSTDYTCSKTFYDVSFEN